MKKNNKEGGNSAMPMLLGIFDWVADFFKSLFDLIPKVAYLLYASLACVLDALQLFFRKLAGLDVYYLDGKAVGGDIVTNFLAGILGIEINPTNGTVFHYGALSTVFWSMVLFGIIIVIAATFISVIKSHYTYDDKAAKGPMQYVYTAGKSVVNILAVPLIVVLGLFLSQAILTALDTITSTNSSSIEEIYGKDVCRDLLVRINPVSAVVGIEEKNDDNKTYIYYDIFGAGGSVLYGNNSDEPSLVQKYVATDWKELHWVGARNQPFSGSLFRIMAHNANRVRRGEWDIDDPFLGSKTYAGPEIHGVSEYTDSPMQLFKNAGDSEELATMIDVAFANNLHMKNWCFLNYDFLDDDGQIVSFKYFTNYLTLGAKNFSKFNVGLVWYYYDMWAFNWIVAFGGLLICLGVFINIILGLISRILMCVVLFLISPPLFGLAPLDGGEAAKGWKKNFIQQALMVYGAVVGTNLVLMILPYVNQISFFNLVLPDVLAQTLIIIAGLVTIKGVIGMISGIIGSADAYKTGGDMAKDVGKGLVGGALMTYGAAKVGKAFSGMAISGQRKIIENIRAKDDKKKADAAAGINNSVFRTIEMEQAARGRALSAGEIKELGKNEGLNRRERKELKQIYDNASGGFSRMTNRAELGSWQGIQSGSHSADRGRHLKNAEKFRIARNDNFMDMFKARKVARDENGKIIREGKLHRKTYERDDSDRIKRGDIGTGLMLTFLASAGKETTSYNPVFDEGAARYKGYKDKEKSEQEKAKAKHSQSAQDAYQQQLTDLLNQIAANTTRTPPSSGGGSGTGGSGGGSGSGSGGSGGSGGGTP